MNALPVLLVLGAALAAMPPARAQWRHIPTDTGFIPLQMVGDTIIGYKTSARQVNYSMDAGLTWHYGVENAWPANADVEFVSSPADWRWVYIARRSDNRDTLLLTRDGGNHFDRVVTMGPGSQWTTPSPVFVSPKSAAKLYGYKIGCARSDDSGGTWRNTYLDPAVDNVANLYEGGGFAIDQSDTARLYEAVSGSERSFWYYSSNGGETWDEWLASGGSNMMQLTAGIPRAGCVVSYDYGRFSFSSDNGRTWTGLLRLADVDTNITGTVPYIPSAVVLPLEGGMVAVCYYRVIAYSTIAEPRWHYLDLPDGVIGYYLLADLANSRPVLLAQRGSFLPDVWVYDGILNSVPAESPIPPDVLVRCYPQPVRAGETMKINVKGDIHGVRVYDLMGRDISVAASSRRISSNVWSITVPSDASGSFFIEVASSGKVHTQRISILR